MNSYIKWHMQAEIQSFVRPIVVPLESTGRLWTRYSYESVSRIIILNFNHVWCMHLQLKKFLCFEN